MPPVAALSQEYQQQQRLAKLAADTDALVTTVTALTGDAPVTTAAATATAAPVFEATPADMYLNQDEDSEGVVVYSRAAFRG